MIRLVRRPLIPGEFDAERWIPAGVLAAGIAAWSFFYFGLTTPACLFRKLTGVPCLACGGTRCVRSLASFDLLSAFAFSPLVALLALIVCGWATWAVVARLRGDLLRVRLATDDAGRIHLRWLAGLALLAHWAWLYFKLPT
ncbi:MAG TPA: hypothetical protein DCY41_04455 [Opitutae bacterium]|nr:hypothetical protein [Opitutae bacterium]